MPRSYVAMVPGRTRSYLVEAELSGCMERIRKEFAEFRSSPELLLAEWQRLKMRIADVVAECIVAVVGESKLKGIYFIDLSGGEVNVGGYVGRDLDLLVVLDDSVGGEREEVEKTIETLVNKLLQGLGVEFSEYTTAPNMIEIHVIKDPQRDPYSQLLRSVFTPPIPIWERGTKK